MIKPLKKPIESFPTVMRVCRYLNIELGIKDYPKIGTEIHKIYKQISGQVPEKCFEPMTNGRMVSVCVYPAEFIPVMINIINEYIKNKKE